MTTISSVETKIKSYKAQIISYIVIGVTIAGLGLAVYDLKHKNTAVTKEKDTLNLEFQKLGDAYQAQGKVFSTQKEAQQAAQQALGKQYADAMAKKDAKLISLYTAMGEIGSQTHAGTEVHVTPTTSGGFTNVTLVQARTGPALSEVAVNFDPTTKSVASNWTSYKEDFFPTVGEWQLKDGGYTGGFRLKRTVSRPDGKGGYVAVGSEEIPLTEATATFGPISFGGTQALAPVPRLSLFGGIGRDTSQKKEVPVLGADYRWTTQVGSGLGIAGNTIFGFVSYRIGN